MASCLCAPSGAVASTRAASAGWLEYDAIASAVPIASLAPATATPIGRLKDLNVVSSTLPSERAMIA